MKLSDTQLLILSSASQRTDHAAVLPANLKGSAAKKVVDRLLNEKLLQELRAKDDMPVWRRGDDNRPYSLRITKAGLRAIEVEDVAEAPDNNAAADPDEVAAADVSTEAKSSERPSRAKRSGAKKTAAVSAKATKASSDRSQTRLQTGQDRSPASTPGRRDIGCPGQGDGMAEALGARISRRHGAQEAETPAALREDRRCQNLSDRHGQSRQDQKDLGGAKGLIECPAWHDRRCRSGG